jgi:regulator of cell morphogenesis and NO signaling
MATLDAETPVGEWVTKYPRTARIFEEFQIDYCCGGRRPLQIACETRQIDSAEVLSKLSASVESADEVAQREWSEVSLTELCDHIEQTHHAYLKPELPRLTQIVEKVASVHGAKHPKLLRLREVFAELRAELEPHMFKEERILFPAIRELEQSACQPRFPFGSVGNPIRMMEHEHDDAGQALARIRELTAGFVVPEYACNTWRVMLDGLQNLEADLHQHIHKENNILFPRAQPLER